MRQLLDIRYFLILAILATGLACEDEAPAESTPSSAEEQAEDQAEEHAEEQANAEDQADDSQAEEQPAAEAHPIWGDWDPSANLDALQGEWVTVWGPDDAVQTRWSIDGNEATHHRSADDPEPQEGVISFEYPGAMKFSVEVDGGSSSTLSSFAREGDDIYVGMGIGGVVLADRLVVRHGRNLYVRHDDGRCLKYEPSPFDGFKDEGISTDCEIVTDGERRLFTFSDPDSDRQITEDQQLVIGDEAIMDSQLRRSQLVSAEE